MQSGEATAELATVEAFHSDDSGAHTSVGHSGEVKAGVWHPPRDGLPAFCSTSERGPGAGNAGCAWGKFHSAGHLTLRPDHFCLEAVGKHAGISNQDRDRVREGLGEAAEFFSHEASRV